MTSPAFKNIRSADWPAPEPVVRLLGIPFWAVSEERVIGHVMESLAEGKGGWIVTPNLDILRRIVREPETGELASRADFLVADGMPLIWASRLRRTPLPDRVTGSNLIHSLSAAAAGAGRSIYLLGGDPGTAEAAAGKLQRLYPGLRVAGWECPPMGFEADPVYLSRLEEQVIGARPDIVYVGLGFPKQEQIIARLRPRLSGAWWMGVGISFSFVCGRVKRAPKWLQAMGLEWIHRFFQEPRRLFLRYFRDGFPFVFRLLFSSFRDRYRPVSPSPRGSAGSSP